MDIFTIESGFMLLVYLLLLAVKIFALVNALLFSAESYHAADKMTKAAWGVILGLGVACHVVLGSPIGFVNLAFTIAAFVYLADVRPALASLTRR